MCVCVCAHLQACTGALCVRLCMCFFLKVFVIVSVCAYVMFVRVCKYGHACVWFVCMCKCVHMCVSVCLSVFVVYMHVCMCVCGVYIRGQLGKSALHEVV